MPTEPQALKPPLGFLDLPPEIRNQIYPHLLSTTHLQPSIRPQHLPPSSQHHHNPPLHTLRITYTGNPTQLHHQPPRYYGCTDETLSPAILATCRQIRLEASPFLYGAAHTFSFMQDYCGGAGSRVEDVRSQLMYSSAAVKLRWSWPKANDENWASLAPQPSPLLAFIRKIGPRNAALVANLELRSSAAGDDVALAAELCGAHMPGLRTLRVCVAGFHFQGSLEHVYAALAGFVEKVRWLEELRVEYVGEKLDVGGRETRGKIRGLEREVRGRRSGGVVVVDDDEDDDGAAVVAPPAVLTQAEMLAMCAEWDEEEEEDFE